MSVCRKLPDGTIQKIAGHTILLDANASEVRQGIFTMSGTGIAGGNIAITKDVTFTDPMPDTDYVVIIETETAGYEPGAYTPYLISSKTVTGFHVAMWFHESAATSITQTCRYTAWKPVKIDGYTALQNKVNNPDSTPIEDSLNLVTSGGVWEAIKNASSVFVGTETEWGAATQTDYDIAVLTDKHVILSVDKTAGTTAEQANLNKIWQGAETDWEALPVATKKVYDFAVIKDAHYILSVDKSTGDTTKVANVPVYDVARNPDWSRAVNVTNAQLKAGYTVPEDGFLIVKTMATPLNGGLNILLQINDVLIHTGYAWIASGKNDIRQTGCNQPVAKNDTVKIEYRNNDAASWTENSLAIFVPYKIADSISGRSPVGAVQAYYGASDPEEGNWLICDGRDTTGTPIELATVYPKLYRFLGNSNVLPDLRGEFLRGAGTNSHSGEGGGGSVGQHQGGSPISSNFVSFNAGAIDFYETSNIGGPFDAQASTSNIINVAGAKRTYATGLYGKARPTNTSVNWIICAR